MSNAASVSIKEYKMKPVLGALTIALLSSTVSGCGYFMGDSGYFRDRGADYQLAQVEPRMTVPAELNSKPLGDMLPVPGKVEQGSGDKFQTPRPQPLAVSADGSDFSWQQKGSTRWLLAQRAPGQLWPEVRKFFEDYQVPVTRAAEELGEIETDWIAFDLQTGNLLVRRLAPAIGANRRVDGQEQRFRVRIEPGVRGASSEIHVLHSVRSQGSPVSTWPERSENPNLERALLAELESYLSQDDGDNVASLIAARDTAGQRATLGQDGAGNPVLSIPSDFNRAWALVGDSLNRADVMVADLNRSAGVYYVDIDQSASEQEQRGFFSRMFGRGRTQEVDPEQRIQVRLTQVAGQVQVTVERSIEAAADASMARDLLTRIRDNLN